MPDIPANMVTSPELTAVLFDMDGTLIDSTGNGNRCWTRWADEAGIIDRSFQDHYHGKPTRQVLRGIVPADQVEAAFARIIELESTDTTGVFALPGAFELLEALPADRRAIVTSSMPSVAAARLRAAGLTAPNVVITADDVTHGKPDPEPFRVGADRLGVDPAACAVVEDTPAGIASARAAGCFVIAVTGTYPAAALPADVVVDSLDQIQPVPDDTRHGPFRLRIGGIAASTGTTDQEATPTA